MDDPFDEFLRQADLAKYKDVFLENEYDSVDLLLALEVSDMKEIGMKPGAIKKLQMAQKQHEQTHTQSAIPTSSQTHPQPPPQSQPSEVVVQGPTRVLTANDYVPAHPLDGWVCQNNFTSHEVFISYRVESDAVNASSLHGTLATTPRGHTALHPYLDIQCLCNGMDWEQGFINGLYKSCVIIVILSEDGLKRTFNAHVWPDNQFLEIQHALKLMQDTAATDHPVIVQPVLMWSTRKFGDETLKKEYFPPVNKFPDFPPAHKSSPLFDNQPMTVQQTFKELFKLQALKAVDTAALRQLVPGLRELVTKTKTATDQGATYHQGGPIQLTADQDSLLRSLLDPVDSTSDRRALEDLYVESTRQWLFDQTTDWVNQDTTDTVLWVNAVAGVGKSVAAAQIANILTATNQLVSALFLKYNDIRKSDPRIVLNTIAYGLCKWYSPIGRKLLDAGHTKDDLDKMSIPDLFKAVIEDPLEAIGDYRPKGSVMILVDALDECSPRDQLLSLLAWRFVELNKTRPWLKLLLTSRPEEDIKAAFDGVPTKTIEPSSEENIRDLEVFIHHRLRVYDILSDSNRTEAVAILLDQSKTFVWINLILNTVDAAAKDGPVTLATIKDINDSAADVGQLYHKTFAKIHSQSSHLAELVTVVSAIATAQSILTPQIIADVFGLEIGVVRECLKSLSLVLDPGANGLDPRDSQSTNTEVKFNHKSVADYLLGDASTGHPWHVSTSFHTVFAKGCLGEILSHDPVINICDIYEFHDKIPDLEDRVAVKITPSLRYSVAHWITHFVWCVEGVAESSPVWQSVEMVDVAAVLTRFVKTHVFFWLECGSLTHVVKPIIEQLAVLRGVIVKAPSTIVDDTTKELVKDTYRFIREFADPIIKSAPQVYNSGFAFTPKQTAIYKTYANQLEDKIPFLVTAGPAPTWDPCEMTLTCHSSQVNSVAISPDGKWIASGSWDKTINVWDAATGQVRLSIDGGTSGASVAAIAPDGKWIASGSDENTIRVWDFTTGQLKKTLKGHAEGVTSVAISPDGKWIASGASDKTIKIWDATTGQVKSTLEGHTDYVCSVAISPDGKWAASGSWDKTIKVWDIITGQLMHTLEGHKRHVYSVAISPDGKFVVSGSLDSTIKVWDVITCRLKRTLAGHSDSVHSVAISPDGEWIVSGSWDNTIKVWSLANGQVKHTLEGHTEYVFSVAVSPDSNWIVSSSFDGTMKIWDAATSQVSPSLEGHTDDVNVVAISPDGLWVASGSDDETIKVWDTVTGQVKHTLKGHSDDVNSVVISPDGKWIASGSGDNTVKIWDASTFRLKHTFKGHTDSVYSVAISPDSKWIVSGSEDTTVRVWNMTTYRLQSTLNGHTNPVYSVTISPDGSSIKSYDCDGVQILWVRRSDQFVRSSASASEIAATSFPLSSFDLFEVDKVLQWIRHGVHAAKVPHALLRWDFDGFLPSGALVMVKFRLVVILPIYLDTPEIRLELQRYLANRAAARSSSPESRGSQLEVLKGLFKWRQ